MPNISSPIVTPAGMPVVNRSAVARAPGFKHLTRAEFDQAVIDERNAIAGGGGLYKTGERLYIIDEEGYRTWFAATGGTDSANAVASHARFVELPGGVRLTLAGDVNTIKRTLTAPSAAAANSGDKLWMPSTNVVYTYTTAWDAGVSVGPAAIVAPTVTATSTLPLSAVGAITPVNAAAATAQTLPSAASAWALYPYGIVVLAIKGTGIPSFAAQGSDNLRVAAGSVAGVQYGMILAQVISATEWAVL